MEIDRAIGESDDKRLKTKYKNAVFVIKRALSLYSIEEVAFSFNGGKDSTFPVRTIYFESPSAFTEINAFTYDAAQTYDLQLDIIRQDFKSGLEALLKANPIRAIFLGVRIGDPTAVGQEQFSPSSPGWPPFMRVNPILDWSYRDVWAFLLTCKVKYCSLYDQGYTSIGSIHDTVPNALFSVNDTSSKEKFKPAYMLSDGRLERAGRVKKNASIKNDVDSDDSQKHQVLLASVIAVGDEILSGTVEDHLGLYMCKKLTSVGWSVQQTSVLRNDIDSVSDEVDRQRSICDMVFIYGGVGPLHSDVTLAGVAKAFGVRLAPDEEFEEYLRHLISEQCTGDRNEMAQLPEGITELLHHEKLSVPLIKCRNVVVLAATNTEELQKEWECLTELTKLGGSTSLVELYTSRRLMISLTDVEVAEPLTKLGLEFPDIYLGCYRKFRQGPIIICLKGKDNARIDSAVQALCKKFKEEVQSGGGDSGFPTKCECGLHVVPLLSKTQENPRRPFYDFISKKEGHLFKWVEDDVCEEVEDAISKLESIDREITTTKTEVDELKTLIEDLKEDVARSKIEIRNLKALMTVCLVCVCVVTFARKM